MAASQNGWVANQPDLVASQLVPGTEVRLSVRKDAPGHLLLEVASAFDRLVEDIDNGRAGLDDWGYAERPIRGGTTLSNHASGTAIDLNALKHPLGATGTFTPEQVAHILDILAVCNGVVDWGGNWDGRKDEMHFEIAPGKTPADCEVALAAMRKFNGQAPLPVKVVPDELGNNIRLIASQLTWGENNDPMNWQTWGWTTWPGGTNEKLTVVDYLRRNNVEVRELHRSVNALHAKIDSIYALLTANGNG